MFTRLIGAKVLELIALVSLPETGALVREELQMSSVSHPIWTEPDVDELELDTCEDAASTENTEEVDEEADDEIDEAYG